ncbi:MAG: stage II sporulation protein P [Blautia sp.]
MDKDTAGRICRDAQERAIETYLPGILVTEEAFHESAVQALAGKLKEQLPFFSAVKEQTDGDRETDKKILKENSYFLTEKLIEENREAGPEEEGQENTSGEEEESQEETEPVEASTAITSIPLEKFQDFDFVISNFYTIDKTTSINREQLNAPELIQKDMRIKTENDQPQILIYHSHSQEGFVDSVPGDPETTIVGAGTRLASILVDVYGYNVIHVTDTFDIVEGILDRDKAYSYAQEKISQVLEENPSVEVVLDLHRDGVAEDKRLVTEVNGKPTAKIMFFNGLSRTTKNGDISYLPNPYIQDNLAFSLQLALKAKEYYPDWLRTIYLRGYRYNLHLRPKALLVECGAQTNTVEEEMNAMEPLADILNKVLKK